MKQNNEQTAAHHAADVVDNVADGIRSAAHRVGGTVLSAAQSVREAAGHAAGAVGDTCEQVTHQASDAFDHTRAKARSLEKTFESSIRENPKTSLLLAALVGAVIGAWWRRK